MKTKLKGGSKWVLVITAALLCAMVFSGCTGEEKSNVISRTNVESNAYEQKIYFTGSIDDDFDGSSVLVVLDKNTGGVNKKHEKSFFKGIEIESIIDLTALAGDINEIGIDWEIWRQILLLKLPIDSKENVINVIRQLEKIDGIKSVDYNQFDSPM